VSSIAKCGGAAPQQAIACQDFPILTRKASQARNCIKSSIHPVGHKQRDMHEWSHVPMLSIPFPIDETGLMNEQAMSSSCAAASCGACSLLPWIPYLSN
jgi:hypothetical protein